MISNTGARSGYGEQFVITLAKQLEADRWRGFSSKNLHHMLRFAEVLLALLPEWEFACEPDVLTGYDELVVRPRSDVA